MSEESGRWEAELVSGPFDGARIELDAGSADPPWAVIVTFVVGERPVEQLWHSYVMRGTTGHFHYLGEDRNLGPDDPDDPDDPADPGAALLDAPVEGLAVVDLPRDRLTRRFYEILFARHPDVRGLFADEMGHQAAALRIALRTVLVHVGDRLWLTHALGALGDQHADWGVTEPMYAAFTECMVAAMAELSGEAWTASVAAAWTRTFQQVGELMVAGANSPGAGTPLRPVWEDFLRPDDRQG